LRDYRPNIVRDLEPNNILPDLGSVLTEKDDAEIKAQSTRQGRCEQLLEIIPRKGPYAFKVFVEALKKEAAHLASDVIDADHKETEKELRQVRQQSANLQRENWELKEELEPEKQDHTKTSQELKELKSLHETFKTRTSKQIGTLAEIVQELIADDSCSSDEALGNWRDSTETQTQTLEMEIEVLTETILEMISGYKVKIEAQQKRCQSLQEQVELLHDLKTANENHQREIEDLLERNNESTEELEKSQRELKKSQTELEKSQRELEKIEEALANERDRAKDYQQKLEEKSEAADVLLELRSTDAKKIESLQKKLNEEKSKSETLRNQPQRLTSRQIPGRTRSNRSRRDSDRRRVLDGFEVVGNARQ